MLDPHSNPAHSKPQQNKHQSLQLNRLLQFIENKKTSSHKLNNILNKDIPAKPQTLSERPQPEPKNHQKSERQSIALNTKNIFVARNKTQSSSPRFPEELENKYYKIFVTKQEILKLHQKQRSQYLPSGIKDRFNFNLITNPEQRHKSNLFPPLTIPKQKRPVIFNKLQDQTTKWLNTQIKHLQDALESNDGLNQSEDSQTLNRLVQKDAQKQRVQQIHLQRQKYNKSLQKLIEKAFKNKDKTTSPQKLNTVIQGIQGYDSKLVIHGQTYETEENRGQSVYASKGKLLSNPNLKIKKDTRFKSQKKNLGEKLTITIDPEQLPVTEAELKKIFDSEYKKRIIHTNREANYMESTLKLKTQVNSKPADYLPSSIRSRSHKKALKLISDLESSIVKSPQENKKSGHRIKLKQFAEKTIDQEIPEALNTLVNDKNQSQRLRRKRQARKMKTKTLFGSEISQVSKSPAVKWQIAGYDWRQSTDEIQENMELQKYVQKIVKKSDPLPQQPSHNQ